MSWCLGKWKAGHEGWSAPLFQSLLLNQSEHRIIPQSLQRASLAQLQGVDWGWCGQALAQATSMHKTGSKMKI